MIVVLHLLPHPIVLIAFSREEDVLPDNVTGDDPEQKRGDIVGDFDIVGLNVVLGLKVGISVGNLVGIFLGALVRLGLTRVIVLTVATSLLMKISLRIKVTFKEAKVLDPNCKKGKGKCRE